MSYADEPRCIAQVAEAPYYLHRHRCERRATQDVGGHGVCGTHARVARRWQDEGRLDTMVDHWWKKRVQS